MDDWLNRFPKLKELFEKIEIERNRCQKSHNVLVRYIELVRSNSMERDAEQLDANLAQLDSTAWENFVDKILRYSCSKPNSSGRRQFWESLNELRGYVLLKQLGYLEIEFIPEEAAERAEFIAKSPTRAILEVKTINRSDNDHERDRNLVQGVEVAPPPDTPVQIPKKLLEKCKKTITKARSQIDTTLKTIPSVDKKIVLLIVNRDFGCSFITMKHLEEKLKPSDLEIVCQLGDF